jgi:hypothetical protein
MYHLMFILSWVFVLFLVVCLLMPGLAMLVAPGRVFHTETKPRWVGLPVLSIGLIILHAFWPLITDMSQLKVYFQ